MPETHRLQKNLPAPDGIETFYEVRSRDSTLTPNEFARLPRHPIYIVLDNLRSAFNVGAIFRLADVVRAQEVLLCGYTAHPPNKKLARTALGTIDSVPWRWFQNTIDAVVELKSSGVQIVALETVTGAAQFNRFPCRFPVGIVLGNEALGVSQDILIRCDKIVDIPVFGYKNSLNVATAAAVVLYELLRQGNWI
ncbi:MAG: RNA methyltransferase [bacterium]